MQRAVDPRAQTFHPKTISLFHCILVFILFFILFFFYFLCHIQKETPNATRLP